MEQGGSLVHGGWVLSREKSFEIQMGEQTLAFAARTANASSRFLANDLINAYVYVGRGGCAALLTFQLLLTPTTTYPSPFIYERDTHYPPFSKVRRNGNEVR